MNRSSRLTFGGFCLLLWLYCSLGCWAQRGPAVQVASRHLIEAYLKSGPSKKELKDGSASAAWAIMKKVGLSEFLLQPELAVGSWTAIWAPIQSALHKSGADSLAPLEAMTWWQETAKEPLRFVRLLGQRKILDARVPKDRERGAALRDALGLASLKLDEVRANVRFERAGWSFTGTASLVPAQRVVRMVLQGSQPCQLTGKARSMNVALKGRLFVDETAPDGFKVALLDNEFSGGGCEDTLRGQLSQLNRIVGGGEARVSGTMVIQVKDDTITGRVQLDLSLRQAGDSLQTGHATYSLRGAISDDGTAQATLTVVSTSGSRGLRDALDKAGALEGQIKLGQGSGHIVLSAFQEPLSWRATR